MLELMLTMRGGQVPRCHCKDLGFISECAGKALSRRVICFGF